MADDFTDTDDNSKFLGEEDPVLDERCTLSKVLTSLNDHMATLAKSMQTMGESISELRQPSSTATAKRDSRAVGSLASKPKRQRTALVSVNRDPEVEALLAGSDNDNGSQNQIENVACESTAEGDEEDELLKTLAAEYMSEDMTSSPVSSQLAAILDKSWSCTLSETKLKEKAAKYYRPQNCERMLAPKVNPEIWSRISNLGQRQDLKFVTVQKALACAGAALAKSTQVLLDSRPSDRDDDGDSQRNEILTSQIDALALLGHANYQLSLRRREMLKPFLKKDYAALCSSQTAVTSLIFGDELQNQLAAIRASNRITNTAVHADQRWSGSSRSQSSRVWRSKSYNNREKSFFYKSPYPRLTNNKSSPSQQKPRRGANRQ